MEIGEFTNEEISYLRSLPAVERVTNGRIRYTEQFKRECIRRYLAGESPARIFHDHGLDSSLIGYKRIERCIARWRSHYGDSIGEESTGARPTAEPFTADHTDERTFTPKLRVRNGKRDLRDLLIAQQVRRIAELEHDLAEAKQELAEAQHFRQQFAASVGGVAGVGVGAGADVAGVGSVAESGAGDDANVADNAANSANSANSVIEHAPNTLPEDKEFSPTDPSITKILLGGGVSD